jgi:hypothetical protein
LQDHGKDTQEKIRHYWGKIKCVRGNYSAQRSQNGFRDAVKKAIQGITVILNNPAKYHSDKYQDVVDRDRVDQSFNHKVTWRIHLIQHLMTIAATGFIGLNGSNQDLFSLVNRTLGAVCGVSAFHADCQVFGYIFSYCEELGHAAKWFSPIVLIQSSHDDPVTLIGKVVAYTYN